MDIHLLVSRVHKNIEDHPMSDQLLVEAAERKGHTLHLLPAKECKLAFNGKPKVVVPDTVAPIKMVLVRMAFGSVKAMSYASLIRQFELAKVPILNGYHGIIEAADKIRSQQVMASHKIPTPLTFAVKSADYAEAVMKQIGRFPVILKQSTGQQGIGIMLIESKRGLRSVLDTLVDEDHSSGPIIIQQYVRESAGKDLRIFVVGNKVVAAMDRVAKKKGEFRSNFSLGGKIKVASLTEEEKKIAIKCAKVFGLHWTGVDIMRAKDGPKVIEVNSNPGLKGITEATGVDVAGHIIDYAVKQYKKLQMEKKKVVKKKSR